jgi:Rieske Fe-S protein
VLAAGAAGAVGALAGCGNPGRAPDGQPGDGDGGPTTVASTADVPVGGGLIAAGVGVVVTQPAGGDFRGFSATCTHQGCTVAEVRDGTINCFCHGSRYSIEDGSVVRAALGLTPDQQRPLPAVEITVDGGSVTVP